MQGQDIGTADVVRAKSQVQRGVDSQYKQDGISGRKRGFVEQTSQWRKGWGSRLLEQVYTGRVGPSTKVDGAHNIMSRWKVQGHRKPEWSDRPNARNTSQVRAPLRVLGHDYITGGCPKSS